MRGWMFEESNTLGGEIGETYYIYFDLKKHLGVEVGENYFTAWFQNLRNKRS